MEVFKPYLKIMNFLWGEFRIPSTLAGGFVRDYIKEKPIKDADIFAWIPMDDIQPIVKELNDQFHLGLSMQSSSEYTQEGRPIGGTLYSVHNSVDGVLPYPLQLMQYIPKNNEHERIKTNILELYGQYTVSKFDLDICKAYCIPDLRGGEIITTEEFEDAHEDKVIWIARTNFEHRGVNNLVRYKERIRRLADKFQGYEVVWEGGMPGTVGGEVTSPFDPSRSPTDQIRVMPGYSLSEAARSLLEGNHADRIWTDEATTLPFGAISTRYWDRFEELFPATSSTGRSRTTGQEVPASEDRVQFQQDASRAQRINPLSSPSRRVSAINEHTIRTMQRELARSQAIEEYRRLHEQAVQSLPDPIEAEGN